MKGWAKVYGGRKLHYYERTSYFGRSTAVCGAMGVVREENADYDLFMSKETGRYPKCKKCLSELEEK